MSGAISLGLRTQQKRASQISPPVCKYKVDKENDRARVTSIFEALDEALSEQRVSDYCEEQGISPDLLTPSIRRLSTNIQEFAAREGMKMCIPGIVNVYNGFENSRYALEIELVVWAGTGKELQSMKHKRCDGQLKQFNLYNVMNEFFTKDMNHHIWNLYQKVLPVGDMKPLLYKYLIRECNNNWRIELSPDIWSRLSEGFSQAISKM